MKIESKIDMCKKLFFLTLLMVCFLPLNVFAKENIKVGFFPFNIYAGKDIKPLEKKIPFMIADEIEKAGAQQSVIIDKKYIDTDFNFDRLKKIGIEYGVDHLITGTVFEAGGNLSIDIKMINIYKSTPEKSFFVQIKGIENLYSAVSQLSKNLISEIFQKKIISKIDIQGNKRIEDDAILRVIDIKPKDIVDSNKISINIKKIYKLGYFEDVKAEREKLDTGIKLIFRVIERPSVRLIKFKGNLKFEEKELNDVVTTNTGSILNIFKINRDTLRIKELYKTKNYHNCSVEYKVENIKNNQADILINIDEGEKLTIEEISFEGNKYFDDDDLLDEMETNEKGILHFLTSSGDLDRAALQRDAIQLESFYKNKGFMDANVSEPEIQYGQKSILVHFEIKEGVRYKVSNVKIQGDLILTEKKLFKIIKTDNLKYYSRDVLRNDIFALTDIYTDKGFAKPEISPIVNRNIEKQLVDLTFIIKKGPPVYFERLTISGNSRTRDKVIRRELEIIETEIFSKKKIEKSLRNLKRLDYFGNIDIKTSQGSDVNKMDINIDVTERPTGNLVFGGGYSTTEKVFGMIEASEGNLFGRGQTIKFVTQVSKSSALFSLEYIEPWLFDIPLSSGFKLYNLNEEFDYYDKKSKGGSLDFSYLIFGNTRIGMVYGYEDFIIENVDNIYTTVDAGRYLTTSLTPSISYDSRDRLFNPTKGFFSKLFVQYADESLGGDISFTKTVMETGIYIPVFWKVTWVMHGKIGYIDDRTNGFPDIDYERFYLGGINSVRGFNSRDIYATKINGQERGGEKFVQLNFELTFPIVEDQGISGVFFYDQGDVFLDSQTVTLSDNYSSFGLGIRWRSPMGPMRLEYGIVNNGKDIEDSGKGRFQFTIGARF